MKKLILFGLLVFVQHGFAKPLTLALDWFVNPNHDPIIAAQKNGYFAEEDIEVELLTPTDPTDPPKWVAAGKVDVAIDYEPHFNLEVKQGLPLKKIGALVDTPLACAIALEESNIKSFADVKGKRIGYSASGADSVILNKMLNHVGLTDKDVTLVAVHYGLLQALLSKQVDVVIGAMRNVEVLELEKLGKKPITFYPEDHGVDSYAELIFVAKKGNDDERLERFMRAIQKAKAIKRPDQTPSK